MASALSELLSEKKGKTSMASEGEEPTDSVTEAMGILFPDADPAEAAAAFRRAVTAIMTEEMPEEEGE